MSARPLLAFRLVGVTALAGVRPIVSLPLVGVVSWTMAPPAFVPSLAFNEPRNSQFIGQVI